MSMARRCINFFLDFYACSANAHIISLVKWFAFSGQVSFLAGIHKNLDHWPNVATTLARKGAAADTRNNGDERTASETAQNGDKSFFQYIVENLLD